MKKTKNLWFKLVNVDDWLNDEISPSDISDIKEKQLRNIASRFMTYHIKFNKNIDDKEEFAEIYQWCEENFYNRYCFWSDQIDCRTKTDAMAFKLRWM